MSMQQSDTRREKLREERAEAQRLGVSVRLHVAVDKTWTEAEDETVRRLYPDYQSMVNVLRHRSYSSLRNRADRLGLRNKRHVWTTKEQEMLRKMWAKALSCELKAAFPDLTLGAIKKQGTFLGLGPRGRPPLVLTGNWLCDAIRDRCRVLGYTMPELDAMAHTGRYFRTQGWHKPRGHLWRPMVSAARTLGGELRVEWPD